ncbi:hypothetical protein ACN47E_003326 [Coniothyrium glycines]
MEPVAAMIGIVAALPQCIQSAKELYDLRSRYKDASVLISAIYSESMVIAASLSQVQNLLQHDALQSKPQLLETIDRALTGCRVVYGCLDEEVRDLVAKADNDDLRFKDKAKFLWKEDTFKELLTQIRGQQSALSLLIQGLQMESISDIRQLVQANSATLDQVVRRSRTLRQSHPRIKVPESIFQNQGNTADTADAESMLKSTEFTFDDEVLNSKAYRRAMAMYTASSKNNQPDRLDKVDVEDESTALGTVYSDRKIRDHTGAVAPSSPSDEAGDEDLCLDTTLQGKIKNEHDDLFGTLERDILSFMPKSISKAPQPRPRGVSAAQTPSGPFAPAPLRSVSAGYQLESPEPSIVPPLPPRRLSENGAHSAHARSPSPDDSVLTSVPSVLSKTSTASSLTTNDASELSVEMSRKPARKPLPLAHKAHENIMGFSGSKDQSESAFTDLKSAEMHSMWLSILDAERKFVERMSKFRKMFYDNIIREWPVLERHLEAVLVGEHLSDMHRVYLLQVMEISLKSDEASLCNPVIFEHWANKVHVLYKEYYQRMPHAVSSLSTTQDLDTKFTPFVNTLGLSIVYFGMGWRDYLTLPNLHLQSYVDNLSGLIKLAKDVENSTVSREVVCLQRALDAVTWLRTITSSLLEDAQQREDIQNLEKRIQTLDANYLSQLKMLEHVRRVIYQGNMAIKLKNQGTWMAVHVVLLDNFLLWGKMKNQRKSSGERIVVVDAPIAVSDLELALPCSSQQFQKTTMFDEGTRGSVLYIIKVKNKTSESKPHLLGLPSPLERTVFWDHLLSVAK